MFSPSVLSWINRIFAGWPAAAFRPRAGFIEAMLHSLASERRAKARHRLPKRSPHRHAGTSASDPYRNSAGDVLSASVDRSNSVRLVSGRFRRGMGRVIGKVVDQVGERVQRRRGRDLDNLAIVETGRAHGRYLRIRHMAASFE